LLFIVRAFFDDTITIAVWTGFHVPDLCTVFRARPYKRGDRPGTGWSRLRSLLCA
jgi:hypothetical protein